jgi:ParB-like chromosome segregation protein Spo0J
VFAGVRWLARRDPARGSLGRNPGAQQRQSHRGGQPIVPGAEPDEPVAQDVPIDLLRPGNSPRLAGVDPHHIRLLAASDGPLPPILVHRATMQVLDGAHRLQAARLNGRETIAVLFFNGTETDAFVAAVQANTAHGLPLTRADRQAAARRLLISHPHRSDRWIASVAGLAASTVGAIRARTAAGAADARIGRDGRVRPVRSASGRKLAGRALAEQPGSSLRDIARIAGISVGTARDVRDRVRRGEDPDLARRPQGAGGPPPARRSPTLPGRRPAVPIRKAPDCPALLQNLSADPSLRYSDTGRALLRWLHAVAQGTSLIDALPPHCMYPVTQILRHCAGQWLQAADQLDERLRAPQPDGGQLSNPDTCPRPHPQPQSA